MSDMYGNEPAMPGMSNMSAKIPLVGLDDAAQAIRSLTQEIQGLKSALSSFGSAGSGGMGTQVGNVFKNLTGNASTASTALKTLFSQMTGTRPAGQSVGSLLDYGAQGDVLHDLAMFPLRFQQSTVSANRQLSLNASTMLSGLGYASNRPMGAILGSVSGQMGTGGGRFGLRGTSDEVVQAFAAARQYGATYDFATPVGSQQPNRRVAGFFGGLGELSNMYPGATLPQLAQTLGGFSANTAAQQQSLFMTGGAFGMAGQGGGQKTVSQWAESILNYLQNQRFGNKRNTPFDYGELLSQNFPGSNIDAWLDINGVPPDMKEAWWNYALNKAKTTGSTGGAAIAITPQNSNLAYQRSVAASVTGRAGLQLAGGMNPAYVNRERSNTSFNSVMASIVNNTVKGAASSIIGVVPDTVEEFLMQFLENSGPIGTILGGAAGYGTTAINLITNLFGQGGLFGSTGLDFNDLLSILPGADMIQKALAAGGGALSDIISGGDVGDVGDWGTMGGTSASSLHPDVGRKVSAMMRANPRIRMNSGRRDEVTQRSLKGKGYSRVSGKSSAHTRGLAADLGPSSEYGWIMKNARKFGLQSGAKHGEPWHVGMSGIGDTADTGTGLLSLLNAMFGGEGVTAANVGSIFPAFFTLLAPKATGGAGAKLTDADIEKLDDPDIGRKLLAAGNYSLGGKWGTANDPLAVYAKTLLQNRASALTDAAHGAISGSGSATLLGAVQALGLQGAGLSDGALVAILANKAGWTGQDLISAVAISGRESGFDPKAHRTTVDPALNRGDRGLWQINAKAWNDWLISSGYVKDALDPAIFDPWINAQAAHGIWARGHNFGAWGFDGHSSNTSANPLTGTHVNEAAQYVHEAGLGDIDGWSSGGSNVRVSGGAVHFNNTFVISGGGNGSSGVDMRRTVTQLADHLEREMQGRLARYN